VKRAVFLDRDGVLNEPVLDPVDGMAESPLRAADVTLCPGAADAVITIAGLGFEPVVVTNQPAAAKGKASVTEIFEINNRVRQLLADQGADIATWKICLHHPDAIVAELAGGCGCRKPAPGMLLEAAGELELSLPNSWIVGDSDADIGAGKAAGCRTVLVEHPMTAHRRTGGLEADAIVSDLPAAALILQGETA
jgi:D-glycero-D-manno-heptose 1,7-bisphosphate phosphatase